MEAIEMRGVPLEHFVWPDKYVILRRTFDNNS